MTKKKKKNPFLHIESSLEYSLLKFNIIIPWEWRKRKNDFPKKKKNSTLTLKLTLKFDRFSKRGEEKRDFHQQQVFVSVSNYITRFWNGGKIDFHRK